MLGLLYHHAILLPLTLIATFNALIFTNAILKNMKKNMKNNMKVYISGKIGEEVVSEATRQKFAKAEEMLKAKGYEVFNPTTSGLGKVADEKVLEAERRGEKTTWYQEILKLDLDALSFCDGIYLLNDYKQSDGARIEYDFALANKKKFLFQEFFHGVDFLALEFDEKVGRGIIEVAPEKSYNKAREDWGVKHIDSVWIPL